MRFREQCPWCAHTFYSEGLFRAHVQAEGAIDKGVPELVVSTPVKEMPQPQPQLSLFKEKTCQPAHLFPHDTQEVFD